jgi:hypothetical protein
LNKGIIPDIVAIGDKSEKHVSNFKQVKNKLKNTILAFHPRVHPQIINVWEGKKILLSTEKESYILKFIENYTGFKGRVNDGGSIASLVFEMVYHLKNNPIIFVGQDLAYPTDRTHAAGSSLDCDLEKRMGQISKKFFKIEDINGDQVWTRDDYYLYLKWFNRRIKEIKKVNDNLEIVDATEGGARIEGTSLMTLKEVEQKYCDQPVEIKNKLIQKLNNYKFGKLNELVNDLTNKIDELKKITEIAEGGLREIDKLISGEADSKKTSSNLEEINQKINELSENIVFFNSEFYDLFSHQISQLQNTNYHDDLNKLVDFYNKLIEGSSYTREILQNQIKKLNSANN